MTDFPTLSRRAVLQGASALTATALWPNPMLAQAARWWERIDAARAAVGDATPSEGGIALDLPLVSEDGSSVALTVTVESPMTPAQYVREIHLFASRNPSPEIAVLRLTPTLGRAAVATRIRLNETQMVGVVAKMSDGKVRTAAREVRVTTSGCFVRPDGGNADEMTPRVRVPALMPAKKPSEVIAMITHPMETGLREDAAGKLVAHRIIKSFSASVSGKPVVEAELFRSVAANPYFRFFIAPQASGTLDFAWSEETGRRATASGTFTVA
jgi:sulfur-oxidizing protein SoxY